MDYRDTSNDAIGARGCGDWVHTTTGVRTTAFFGIETRSSPLVPSFAATVAQAFSKD